MTNKQALIAKIKKQIESFDTVVLKEDEANSLLDELEAKDKRIAEFDQRIRTQNRHACELFDEAKAQRQRIAELEARKVTVKLPADYRNSDGSINDDMFNTCAVVGAFSEELAAAGIGVKGE